MTKAECDAQGITWSIVAVDPFEFTDANGATAGRCYDGLKATQFRIRIFARQANYSHRNWRAAAKTIASNEWDLVQTVTHEFGHTYGMNHPIDGNYGVMEPTSIGQNRQRDLYWYDVVCGHQKSGHRRTQAYSRSQLAGVLGSESSAPGLGGATLGNISSGVSWQNGIRAYSTAAKYPICVNWSYGLNQGMCLSGGIGQLDKLAVFTNGTFQENTSIQRVFVSTIEDYTTNGDVSSTHWLWQYRSSSGFQQGTISSGVLKECTNMDGFMSCPAFFQKTISTNKHVAVSWNNYNNRTVFAWVNQNRANALSTGQVRVSVGMVSDYVLPTADTLNGVQSSVSPGLACEAYAVNSPEGAAYDCILAVVAPEDPAMHVRVYRFWAYASSQAYRYSLQISPNYVNLIVAQTASRIAAWRHNGQFWIAVRQLSANQNLRMYYSADSTIWQQLVLGSYSDVGPSASSWSSTDSRLLFVK